MENINSSTQKIYELVQQLDQKLAQEVNEEKQQQKFDELFQNLFQKVMQVKQIEEVLPENLRSDKLLVGKRNCQKLIQKGDFYYKCSTCNNITLPQSQLKEEEQQSLNKIAQQEMGGLIFCGTCFNLQKHQQAHHRIYKVEITEQNESCICQCVQQYILNYDGCCSTHLNIDKNYVKQSLGKIEQEVINKLGKMVGILLFFGLQKLEREVLNQFNEQTKINQANNYLLFLLSKINSMSNVNLVLTYFFSQLFTKNLEKVLQSDVLSQKFLHKCSNTSNLAGLVEEKSGIPIEKCTCSILDNILRYSQIYSIQVEDKLDEVFLNFTCTNEEFASYFISSACKFIKLEFVEGSEQKRKSVQSVQLLINLLFNKQYQIHYLESIGHNLSQFITLFQDFFYKTEFSDEALTIRQYQDIIRVFKSFFLFKENCLVLATKKELLQFLANIGGTIDLVVKVFDQKDEIFEWLVDQGLWQMYIAKNFEILVLAVFYRLLIHTYDNKEIYNQLKSFLKTGYSQMVQDQLQVIKSNMSHELEQFHFSETILLIPFMIMSLELNSYPTIEFIKTQLQDLFEVKDEYINMIYSFYFLYFDTNFSYGQYQFTLQSFLHHHELFIKDKFLIFQLPCFNLEGTFLLYDLATFARQCILFVSDQQRPSSFLVQLFKVLEKSPSKNQVDEAILKNVEYLAAHSAQHNQKQIIIDDTPLINIMEGVLGQIKQFNPEIRQQFTSTKKKILITILNSNNYKVSSVDIKGLLQTFFCKWVTYEDELYEIADYDLGSNMFVIKEQYKNKIFNYYQHRDTKALLQESYNNNITDPTQVDYSFGSDYELKLFEHRFIFDVRNKRLIKPNVIEGLLNTFVNSKDKTLNFGNDLQLVNDIFLYYTKIYLSILQDFYRKLYDIESYSSQIIEIEKCIFEKFSLEESLIGYKKSLQEKKTDKDKKSDESKKFDSMLQCTLETINLLLKIKPKYLERINKKSEKVEEGEKSQQK